MESLKEDIGRLISAYESDTGEIVGCFLYDDENSTTLYEWNGETLEKREGVKVCLELKSE